MRGRKTDGTFETPFDPTAWSRTFTEGDSWHWSWCVFHDPQGLVNLMGGKDKFNSMMDSVFVIYPDVSSRRIIHEMREMQVMNMGQYAHGNQPIQHMIYLYGYSGQPWKAQYWLREVMNRLYSAAPDGYCGDEDNGQTSSWYVFSAMGFYPVCPGSNQYVVGTPYFKNVKLHLEDGKTVNISAPANSDVNRYIKSMTVNGKTVTRNYLTHDEIKDGASIVFDMSATPVYDRGTQPSDFPYSFSNELNKRKK